MSEVNINYKGSTIAGMDASGTKTLQTSGKYCEGNIEVVYSKPAAPVPSLQTKAKTYTPTESSQSEAVTADSGYDGLDTVNVNVEAIPSTYVGSDIARRTYVSFNASTGIMTAQNGYYESDTTRQLTTQGLQIFHPSTTDQTLEGFKWLTGNQTFRAVTTTNLTAANIKNGVTVQVGDSADAGRIASITGTYDAGGSSEWKHIVHTTLTVNTTSTSAASAGTLSCGTEIVDKGKIIYVRVRDTEGPRAGYCAGSDAYFMNYNKANGSTSAFAVPAVMCYRYTTSSAWAGTAGQYGVYGYSISNTGVVTIRRRYNSNYSLTIDSTFDVDVFTLEYPSGYPSIFSL